MSEEKTVDPVTQSYEVNAIMEVCVATLWQLGQSDDAEQNKQCAAVRTALEVAQQKWGECHDALEDAALAAEKAAEPKPVGKS